MPKLLINVHCPSPNTQKLRDAMVKGASHPDITGVEVRVVEPLEADSDDVQWADGILLGTTENFGYMSGAMKDFFDRIYYPCLEETQALPYAIAIRAGLDGTGTRTAMEKIITGLKWRPIQEPLISQGKFNESFLKDWETLGMTMAAGLEAGIY
ncbi:MAG: NAD(P)H-dependent oxidoreductase [Cellvibrionaceae bacterium]